MIEAFPLYWPAGVPRTTVRSRARFKTGQRFAFIRDRLLHEVQLLGAANVVLSTNIPVRNDGLPYASQGKMLADPGVAVYFKLKGASRVLACDKWASAAENMAAIAGHIEAIRAVDRYGVGTLEQAFAGYQALPAQASPWWTVLEFDQRPVSLRVVEDRYTELAKVHHPDRGGRPDTMAKINAARDAARIDLEPRV